MAQDEQGSKNLPKQEAPPARPFPPPIAHLIQFFRYDHLPEHLKEISRPFCILALEMAEKLPSNAETTAGLRKLLEAKDCAVRALLAK